MMNTGRKELETLFDLLCEMCADYAQSQ